MMTYHLYEGHLVSSDELLSQLSYFKNKTKNVDKVITLLHISRALSASELEAIRAKNPTKKQQCKAMYTIVCGRWEKVHGDLVDAFQMTDNHKLILKLNPFRDAQNKEEEEEDEDGNDHVKDQVDHDHLQKSLKMGRRRRSSSKKIISGIKKKFF